MYLNKSKRTSEFKETGPGHVHTQKWDDCVKKVKAKGTGNAYAICTASLGAKAIEPSHRKTVREYNHNHGEDGKFSSGSGGGGPRYLASSEGMAKGYYKVVDQYTGHTTRSGFSTKGGALDSAKSLNADEEKRAQSDMIFGPAASSEFSHVPSSVSMVAREVPLKKKDITSYTADEANALQAKMTKGHQAHVASNQASIDANNAGNTAFHLKTEAAHNSAASQHNAASRLSLNPLTQSYHSSQAQMHRNFANGYKKRDKKT